jgi:hypothetical protein
MLLVKFSVTGKRVAVGDQTPLRLLQQTALLVTLTTLINIFYTVMQEGLKVIACFLDRNFFLQECKYYTKVIKLYT